MTNPSTTLIVLNSGKRTIGALQKGFVDLNAVNYASRKICIHITETITWYYDNTPIDTRNSILLNRFSKDLQFAGILTEQMQIMGNKVLNPICTSYKNGAEKIAQMMRSAAHNIQIPETFILEKEGYTSNKRVILEKSTFPLVCKTDGNKGEQVSLIHTEDELSEYMKNLSDEEVALIQEYIDNTFDIRIIVAFGEVIGAIKRTATDGAFLNNVSQGGSVALHIPTEEETAIAIKATAANKTDIAGVDLFYKNKNCLFLELNQGFGIHGFESIHTDKEVFTRIAELLETKHLSL